jgi:hypothetical protein
MPDPRLIKLIQRFPTTTAWQRASPANTHYEMLASLDCFSAERFCRQQDLAQQVTVLVAQRSNIDLVRALDLDRTTLMERSVPASPCHCSIR